MSIQFNENDIEQALLENQQKQNIQPLEHVSSEVQSKGGEYKPVDTHAVKEYALPRVQDAEKLAEKYISSWSSDFKENPKLNKILSSNQLPFIDALKITHSKNDPKIFATISRCDANFFKNNQILEFTTLAEYKNLARIRFQDYMAILIKLLEVFKTEEDFKLILKEILKEKALVAFLFDSIDISDLENATIENKDEYFDFELLIIKSMVDCQVFTVEDDYNMVTDDNEELDLELQKEELRWQEKVIFLTQMQNKIASDTTLKSLKFWYEAKVESLYQLDIRVKDNIIKSDEVFDLLSFYEAKKRAQKDPSSQQSSKDQFSSEFQTQIKSSFLQAPRINQQSIEDENINQMYPCYSNKTSIREKEVLRIRERELQSDYLIHVWRWGEFGFEKKFEKRIYTQDRTLKIKTFEFLNEHQYLMVKVSKPIKTQLIFNTKAPFKDPISLEYDQEILGVYYLKNEKENAGIPRYGVDKHCLEQLIIKDTEHSFKVFNILNGTHIKTNYVSWIPKTTASPQKRKTKKRTIKQFTNAIDSKNMDIVIEDNQADREMRFSPIKGIYSIRKEKKESTPDDKKQIYYSIITNEQFKLPFVTFKSDNDPQITLSQDTQKILIQYEVDSEYIIKCYEFDQTSKSYIDSKDKFDPLSLDQEIMKAQGTRETIIKAQALVYPTEDNFIICYQEILDKKYQKRIYYGSKFLRSVKEQQLTYQYQDNIISIQCTDTKLSNNKISNYKYLTIDTNELNSKISQTKKQLFKWVKTKERYLFCIELHANLPYIFFIYNHDQVYMTNIQDIEEKGKFYYMNDFLQIPVTSRPLTAFGYIDKNKMKLSVPCLEKNYTLTNFQINVHAIQSKRKHTGTYNLQKFCKQTIHKYNEKALQEFITQYKPKTLEFIKDNKPNYNEIQVTNDYNAVSIGFYNYNQIILKIKLHISYPNKTDYNALYSKEENYSDPQIFYRRYFYSIYTQKEINYVIKDDFMNGDESILKPYENEMPEYYISDVLYDSLDGESFTVYVIHGTKDENKYNIFKQFQFDIIEGTQKSLEEQKYNTLFSGSINARNPFFFSQQKNIFANKAMISTDEDYQRILYSKVFDTNEKKLYCTYLSNDFIYTPRSTQIQKCVSINGARLFLFRCIPRSQDNQDQQANESSEEEEEEEQQIDQQQKDGYEDEANDGEQREEEKDKQIQEENQTDDEKIGEYQDDGEKDGSHGYIIGQALHLSKKMFLNSFDYFIHKSVPVVNEEQLYSVQFSLTTEFRQHDLEFNNQLGYPSQDHRTYNRIRYISPGLIINYRNAEKQIIPLSEYGYEFIEIIKYNQSGNGQFIILAGIMKKPSNSRELIKEKINQYYQDNITLEGIFLFHLCKDQIELKSIIPYAKRIIIRRFINQGCQLNLDQPVQSKQYDNLTQEEKRNQLQHEEEEKKVTELSLAHETEEINIKLQEMLTKENQKPEYIKEDLEYTNIDYYNKDKLAVREEFAFIKDRPLLLEKLNNNMRQELKLKLEKKLAKEYQQKRVKQSTLTVPEFLKSMGEEEESKKNEKDEKKPDQQKVAQQQAQDSQKKKKQSDFEEEYALFNTIKDLNIQRFEFQRHDKSLFDIPYLFTLIDNDLIQNYKEEDYLKFVNQYQHSQMVLKVCLDGEILLIDRYSNTLYCFIFNEATFDFEFRKQQFPRDFVIQNVDIDQKLLVVASNYDYRVYDLNKTESSVNKSYKLSSITNLIYSSNELFNSYELNQPEKIEKIQEFEQPKLKIDQINIKGSKVLINYIIDESNEVVFIIYDYQLKTQILQLSDETLVSGDKNHLWDKINNIVYDIQHMAHTLFFWNEAPFSHPQVFSGNTFYVTKDRTILCTKGYIQFTYDYLNAYNRSITCDSTVKLPLYLQAYKIDDKDNSLSFIGEDENWTKKLLEVIKNIEQIKQYHIDTYKKPENWQDKQFTYFFLTYVYPQSQAINENDEKQVKTVKNDDNKAQPGYNILRTLFSQSQIKLELIEEILKVIILTDSPMKTKTVNSVFVQLLGQNSPSFQEYIEKTRLQTSQMKTIDKFFLEDDVDGGQYFFCTNQIIVDRDFYLKYKNYETQTKKEVEVTYIEVGDILVGQQGDQLMTKLSHPDNLDKMSLPFLEKIVLFQWEKVKKNIYRRLFFPFILQLILFSFFATFQVSYNPDDNINVNLPIYISCVLSLVAVLTYFMYMEVIQFLEEPTEYFTTVWNIADLITILLCYLIIFLDLIGVGHTLNRKMSSISVIILWIKFFYFLRIFDQTAFLIRMITEIVNDMRNFLIVLIIGVVGFCNGFYILTQGYDKIMGSNVYQALIYTYRMALGDFQLDDVGDLPENDLILFWILFIIASLFVVIVLLNLLIAIMGDTFGRVNENITNLSIREKAMLVDENEHLFNRSELFKDCKYLVIIKDSSFQQSSLQNWDGQINSMKRQVIDNIDKFKKEIIEMLTKNDIQITEIKKKMIEGEDKSFKNNERLFSQLGSNVKEINENFEQKLEIALTKQNQAQQRELLSLKFQIFDKIEKKELNPKMFEQFQIKKEDLISFKMI